MADPKKTLTSAEIVDAVPAGWSQDGQTLTVRFATGDFATGLELVDRIGASAEEANHHPDLTLTYPEVTVTLSSHDVGGITSRDLDLARRASEHAAALGVAPAVDLPRPRRLPRRRADAVRRPRSETPRQDRYGSVAVQGCITRGRTRLLWWDRRMLPAVTLPGSRRAPVRAWSQRPRRGGAHTMRIGRRTFATLGPLAALGLLAACSDDGGGGGGGGEGDFVTDLTFGTGGTGGVYYPLGGEYAAIYEENIDGVTVTYTDSGASVENIGKIFQGEWQLGIVQSDTANTAVLGEGEFEGAQVDNSGWIAGLYPEAAHIVTLAGNGIESAADLKGK